MQPAFRIAGVWNGKPFTAFRTSISLGMTVKEIIPYLKRDDVILRHLKSTHHRFER
jgi:hypothetical protein